MKKIQVIMVLLMLTALMTNSYAQKYNISLISGSLSVLNGEKSVKVEFNYDNLKVGKEDEKDYIQRRKDEYNQKEPGKGDKWETEWISDRKAKYEPAFCEAFTKATQIETESNMGGKYKIILHTSRIEPGFTAVVSFSKTALAVIDATVSVVEIATGQEVAKVSMINVPTYDSGFKGLDTGARIQGCYTMAGGNAFGKYLMKQLNK